MNLNPIGAQLGGGSQYFDFPPLHSFSGLRLIAPPLGEPVTQDMANMHCRIDVTDENALIGSYISAARQHCEDRTRRGFLPQVWRLSLQGWPSAGYIRLPIGPLLSVQAFRYTDSNLNTSVLVPGVDYQTDAECDLAEIHLPYSGSWPNSTLNSLGSAIQVDFRIGYLAFSSVVTVTGASVAWIAGDLFDVALAGSLVAVNGQAVTVSSVASGVSLTLASAPNVTSPITGLANAQLTINQLPAPITQAILMLVSHWYENREAVVVGRTSTISTKLEMAVDALLRPYTLYRF